MKVHSLFREALGGLAILQMAAGLALANATPVAAANYTFAACAAQSGIPSVSAASVQTLDGVLSSSSAGITLYAPTSAGPFVGDGSVTIHCVKNGLDIGIITDTAQVQVEAVISLFNQSLLPGTTIQQLDNVGNALATPAANNPITISFGGGTGFFRITDTTPGLDSAGTFGENIDVVLTVASTNVLPSSGNGVGDFSPIHAAISPTPELGSLTLFGSGALTLAGYGLARRRGLSRRILAR